MNVLIISQCSKNALKETSRILDQFAERKGIRTWQTNITQEGLLTIRKLLKKTARRNTAVACHWLKKANYSELLWIVGNLEKFNSDGTIPTNYTSRDVLRSKDENSWHTADIIAILAGIAGLFHDVGKANFLFQQKLRTQKITQEPVRHEWVSLVIFKCFVEDLTDKQWLEKLASFKPGKEKILLDLFSSLTQEAKCTNLFKGLPILAQVVGWLIVSHHRLLQQQSDHESGRALRFDCIATWLNHKLVNATANSIQANMLWSDDEWLNVWTFPENTPLGSHTWCKKANSLGKKALKNIDLPTFDWLQDRFSSHISRMVLMLADHCYSASDVNTQWQDKNYKSYANTDRKTGQLKQKLDEHNVGVGHYAYLIARRLPHFIRTLPAITRHKGFTKRTPQKRFDWQNKAHDLARSISERSFEQGFFGVNMASTGSGKTFGNARIMYGLANEKKGCRFSVAIGLRTLTLQTGDALRELLHLSDDDLAVLIGSQAVRELYDQNKRNDATMQSASELAVYGSESLSAFDEEEQYIHYEGMLDDSLLSAWLGRSPKLHKLVSAPVLVSTIDHLIPATEGERGGKQIAPMMRLLTADLVLDEPDDFNLDDLPALTRLVNWAGMLGARVLLSSATLPPDLVKSLFEAYRYGRCQFNRACRDVEAEAPIYCAWFDEFGVSQSNPHDSTAFEQAHTQFVAKRISKLSKHPPLRIGKLVPISCADRKAPLIAETFSSVIVESIKTLHGYHHQKHPSGRTVSFGIIRMANINKLVAVAKFLLSRPFAKEYHLHFCIYHSQFPLLIRSEIENRLDSLLIRHRPEQLWTHPYIQEAFKKYTETHHVFIVLATPVAEVGRDHDYDWAIAEPSSMRSLIQLAGRVQRHRQLKPANENFYILTQNFKALQGKKIAYTKPGFETEHFPLLSHDLGNILHKNQYQKLDATSRINYAKPLDPQNNLVDLEHAHTAARLFGDCQYRIHASLWWKENPTWTAQLQYKTPFRKSYPQEDFVLYFEEEGEQAKFCQFDNFYSQTPIKQDKLFQRSEWEPAHNIHSLVNIGYETGIISLAIKNEVTIAHACRNFGFLQLPKDESGLKIWTYHPLLGIYRNFDE